MPFEPGQPKIGGRREGIPNRATAEFKGFWQQFLASTEYRDSLKRRMLDGKADHMERYVAELLYGRPRQEIDVHGDKSITVIVSRMGYAADVPPVLIGETARDPER
jgi:hypothetical protein